LGFENLRRKNIIGTFGALDGCQIPIKQPTNDKSSYYNRNKFHSITLQGICDHKKIFTDVYAGWPGAAHDGRVWKHSPVYNYLKDNSDPNHHILADSAYPLSSFCLTRYKNNGHLTDEEKYYNKIQSSNRVIIEQAFGLLKCRFRRLKMLDMSLIDKASKVITVACILHNICIMNNDILQYTRIRNNDDDQERENDNDDTEDGIDKREGIKTTLWNNRNN